MLLEIKNLNKTYHSGKVDFQALYDINLSIKDREFTAIAGPSGSGKTTLLNSIGCIDRVDSGDILMMGENLTDKTQRELARFRRQNYGFIFQTYNLIPVLTVYENVELPLKLLKKLSDNEIHGKVHEMLNKVGLQGLDKRMPLELSGGQQQRVSIARALVKKPKVVLADEPTANLDSKTGQTIVALMKELNKKEGITFLFSTHDHFIMEQADRLIEMHDGRIKK
ncbi:MAG: ABC transporter ATP-binding protein [Spirochaetes bacterium]|nr:ABC transporter ATP-binding protein [Spirochaetota bacterium]